MRRSRMDSGSKSTTAPFRFQIENVDWPRITFRTALWIARLKVLIPEGEDSRVTTLATWARAYANRERWAAVTGEEIETNDLDVFFALEGWQDDMRTYVRAQWFGLIPNEDVAGRRDIRADVTEEGWDGTSIDHLLAIREATEQTPEGSAGIFKIAATGLSKRARSESWPEPLFYEALKRLAAGTTSIWESEMSVRITYKLFGAATPAEQAAHEKKNEEPTYLEQSEAKE